MNGKQICTVLLAGHLLAAVIEYSKVFVTRTWTYNRLMPTIFGLGLSPLLQLSSTGLLALWLSGRVLYEGGWEVNSELIERFYQRVSIRGIYNTFTGVHSHYDGFGRSASDKNILYALARLMSLTLFFTFPEDKVKFNYP